ncbi:HupE / UreJ protein [Tepidimonas thermarum]|uniref:HupE / UreJ protein n=1 Tax=Tepidimonas thermarum TaxID=335431 RepID=A0A554X318_9BURK|nr:HupE/UreJ family protein [Tepidimonas thermarum]TSE30227.1 HupE / UreJ protein [Tepidimonas thermarum]
MIPNDLPSLRAPVLRHVSHAVVGAGLWLAAHAALAHTGADAGAHHGWMAGLMHPWTGLDHLIVMLAVGVWSALTTQRVWLAPLSFASVLWLGAWSAQLGLTVPAVEPMIVTSMVVIGVLIALQAAWPAPVVAAIVAGFAWFHGAAHGQELLGHAALAGMVVSTAILHALGIAIGMALRRWHAWAPRAGGALVALAGLYTLLTR